MRTSTINPTTPPTAFLSDGRLIVPLYAVSSLDLEQSYHAPRIPGTGGRTPLGTHDDRIALTALLVGRERFQQQTALQTLAEGVMLGSLSDAVSAGLLLATTTLVRTQLFVESLSFRASAEEQGVIRVVMSLRQIPARSSLVALISNAALSVKALAVSF